MSALNQVSTKAQSNVLHLIHLPVKQKTPNQLGRNDVGSYLLYDSYCHHQFRAFWNGTHWIQNGCLCNNNHWIFHEDIMIQRKLSAHLLEAL